MIDVNKSNDELRHIVHQANMEIEILREQIAKQEREIAEIRERVEQIADS